MKIETLLLAAILGSAVPARAAGPAPADSTRPDRRPAPEKNPDPSDAKEAAAAVAKELPPIDKAIGELNETLQAVATCHSLEDALKSDFDQATRRYAAEFKGSVPLEFSDILNRKRMRTEKAREHCADRYKQANVKFEDTLNKINAVNVAIPGTAQIKTRMKNYQNLRRRFTAMERGSKSAGARKSAQ